MNEFSSGNKPETQFPEGKDTLYGGVIKHFPGMDTNDDYYHAESYNKSKFYKYDAKKYNLLRTFIIGGAFIIGWSLLIFLLALWIDIDSNMFFLLAMSGMIPLFAFIIYAQCFVLTKELKNYLKDEEGLFYLIKITRAASTPTVSNMDLLDKVNVIQDKYKVIQEDRDVAQDKYYAFNCVQNFKKGNRAWNWWSGGEYRVKLLGSLKLDKVGRKKSTFVSTVNGRSRKIKIDNGYIGLAEECDTL